MESLGSILNPILDFLQTGFDKVNAVQGLLIALFATVLMRKWAQLFIVAAGATLFYVALNAVIPILTKGGEIKLPRVVDIVFWQDALSFFVGFVIIIAMFFAVKSVLFRSAVDHGGHGKKAKASH
jgi:hypothetical protein